MTALWALTGCDCRAKDRSTRSLQAVDSAPETDPADRPSALEPSPREPGPPLPETASQLERAQRQAQRWTHDLLDSGLARREVASMADIRGYRFFRRRSFGQALAWFTRAVKVDPTYEPALFNAARAAALRGDAATARRLLAQLHDLGTPLSLRQLAAAARHEDFAVLRRPAPTHDAS